MADDNRSGCSSVGYAALTITASISLMIWRGSESPVPMSAYCSWIALMCSAAARHVPSLLANSRPRYSASVPSWKRAPPEELV